MTQFSINYNLEERTAKFGEDVIGLCKSIKINIYNEPAIKQILRSATSVGANYCEANNASSRKDFKNKIFICKKEIQETKHWLRMLAKCNEDEKENIRNVWKEAQELTLIFQKITNSLKINN
jgi:four helix bundle protein